MSTLEVQPINPANKVEKATEQKDRIPMSLPTQRLAVPEISGYHLHWFAGNAARLQRALKGGYTFVEQDEVDLNRVGIADANHTSGHQDLGSRVTIPDGIGENGQPQSLVLMKIPLQLWLEDQQKLEDRNEMVAASLRGGKIPGDTNPHGTENRYIPQANQKAVASLFTPKRRPVNG